MLPSRYQDGKRHYSVYLPRSVFTEQEYQNLLWIIASHTALLKCALGTNSLSVIATKRWLEFPWFLLHDRNGEIDAYHCLIHALRRKAQSMIVQRTPCKASNLWTPTSRLAMRLFMFWLGLSGREHRATRRILLRNFPALTYRVLLPHILDAPETQPALRIGGSIAVGFHDCSYTADVCDTPSGFGIDGGRIRKLLITVDGQPMAYYDWMWYMEPTTDEAKIAYWLVLYAYN